MSDCLFCHLVTGKIPSNKVYEDDTVLAFHDVSPQAPVHILIIPKQHLDNLNALSEEHEPLIGKMMRVARHIAQDQGFAEAGYRTVINCNHDGGQTVGHLHMHLLAGRALLWPPG